MTTVTINYTTASNKARTGTFEIVERNSVSSKERMNMISDGWQLIFQDDLDDADDGDSICLMAKAANVSGGFLYREVK